MFVRKKEKSSDVSKAKNSAIAFLARREYSKLELYQKLFLRYTKEASLEALSYCVSNNYQSDLRYSQMLCRHTVNQFYGPLRLIRDAKVKGISNSLIQSFIDETDWDEIAKDFLLKKYTKDELSDYEKSQKVLAVLARRGFSNSCCIRAFELAKESFDAS